MYYTTPNHSVAVNLKVASSSLARAIIKQFCVRADWLIRTAACPAGESVEDRQWHRMCPRSETATKPVVLLVRDPVDRFITACQQIGIGRQQVDAAIDALVNDKPITPSRPSDVTPEKWIRQRAKRLRAVHGSGRGRPDYLRDEPHFQHQHSLASGPTTCFRFPRDIAAAAAFVGIQSPVPEINKAKREKPTLTPQQAAAVRAYYAADQSLFDAIAQPGYVYTP